MSTTDKPDPNPRSSAWHLQSHHYAAGVRLSSALVAVITVPIIYAIYVLRRSRASRRISILRVAPTSLHALMSHPSPEQIDSKNVADLTWRPRSA